MSETPSSPSPSLLVRRYQDLNGLPEALLQRYNTTGPRYTSYPTAPVWTSDFDAAAFTQALNDTNQPTAPERALPLSLYVHLPFCEHRCLFCSCNVIITQQREQAEKYLGYLFREIDRMAERIADDRPVVQYHWGGGTPTYLSCEQMQRLFTRMQKRFHFDADAEISIEVDPRVTTVAQLETLRDLGFNRVSMGVQDFQPETQSAIERIQSVEETRTLTEACRRLGFDGVNFDLIYGLPHQTPESFDRTLDDILALRPDRIALYNFAYVPWLSPHQKQIPEASLPQGQVKFAIFRRAIECLLGAGYGYIGMDHFALPGDELTRAQDEGSLGRNFMGYTTRIGAGCELLGFGVSAISGLHRFYAQNEKKLSRYYQAIDRGELATNRGFALSADDLLRRDIINQILCQGRLDYATIQATHGISVPEVFADALTTLGPMADDGLLIASNAGLTLTPLGRIFSRNIAMPFDAYLAQKPGTPEADRPTFSKTL